VGKEFKINVFFNQDGEEILSKFLISLLNEKTISFFQHGRRKNS